eukprot:2949098-Prymnesium_polylepis.1
MRGARAARTRLCASGLYPTCEVVVGDVCRFRFEGDALLLVAVAHHDVVHRLLLWRQMLRKGWGALGQSEAREIPRYLRGFSPPRLAEALRAQ